MNRKQHEAEKIEVSILLLIIITILIIRHSGKTKGTYAYLFLSKLLPAEGEAKVAQTCLRVLSPIIYTCVKHGGDYNKGIVR